MNPSDQLPNQANSAEEQSIRALTEAFQLNSLSSTPQRYTPTGIHFPSGQNGNQQYQPGSRPSHHEYETNGNGSQGLLLAAYYDNEAANTSVLQAARGVLETKMGLNSGQQQALSSPAQEDNRRFPGANTSIDQQIYGSPPAKLEPSTQISSALWGFPSGTPSSPKAPPAPSLRAWNTLPRNYMEGQNKRSSILDSSIFPAPDLAPKSFPQNPMTSPIGQKPDSLPWGSIGDRRSAEKGSYANAFMPTNVTVRKKASAPMLQSSYSNASAGSNPFPVYQPQMSSSPKREYPHQPPEHMLPQNLTGGYEAHENYAPSFSVDKNGSPRKASRFYTSPSKSGLQHNMSMLRSAGEVAPVCSGSCVHKEQALNLKNECEYYKKLLMQVQDNSSVRAQEANKQIGYLYHQIALMTQENQRLTREVTLHQLRINPVPARLSPTKYETPIKYEKTGSESWQRTSKQFMDEFNMLYKTLDCWAGRFMKFPNGDQVPKALSEKLGNFLTTPELFGLVMHDKTKEFVMAGFIARVFLKHVFAPEFIKKVAAVFETKQKEDPDTKQKEDLLDTTISEEADVLAASYHDLTIPILSRQHDATAIDGSRKALIEVFRQAARLSFKMNKATDTFFAMVFPETGDHFSSSLMTNGDQTEPKMPDKELEQQGAKVKLASHPYISLGERSPTGNKHPVIVHRATVFVM